MKGVIQSICDDCIRPSCISPAVCSNLDTSHKPLTELYRAVDKHPKIKKSFIGSGIRYDLLVPEFNKKADPKDLEEYTKEVLSKHVSGRLKVAPEHTSDKVLKLMRKPSFKYFHTFKKQFDKINKQLGLKLQLIPYFISSHPESGLEDMANLACETKDMGFQLEQVQGFTPTPMTVATVIYYSGYHPYTLKRHYTPRSKKERDEQHQFFFWYKRENQDWIRRTLSKLGRMDMLEKLLPSRKKEDKHSKKEDKYSRKDGKKKRDYKTKSRKRRR